MKSLYNISCTLLILAATCMSIQAVNLDSLSEKKRNELLLSMAKEVVLRYGPCYFRDDPEPEIGLALKTKNFKVTYLPKSEEKFDWGYAVKVFFDNKTGLPTSASFGNGLIHNVSDAYKAYLANKYYGKKYPFGKKYKKKLEKEVVETIQYQTVNTPTIYYH